MSKAIRISNGQGFWGDSIDAPYNLVKYGQIDYLTLYYLAEVTLSIMQRQKIKDQDKGYATDFIDLMERIMLDIVDKNIKVVTNAGGVNPEVCKSKLIEISKKLNVNIKIAIIKGDDILSSINSLLENGVDFENMDNGGNFQKIKNKVYSANAYIDSFSIAKALETGANIVLAGRVSDPGLVVGPAIYEFNWKKTDYDKIATATLAGHVIECGAQCSGGNFSGWEEINDLTNVGYPIVTLKDDTTFTISKPEGSGGLINRYTVIEQVLYEMGDPKRYISPDVVVDFTSFDVSEKSDNVVQISGVKGYVPTETYKVSINYFNGYKAAGQLTISGPKALKKAELTANLIWGRLKKAGFEFEETLTEFLGFSSCYGSEISENLV